MQFISIVDAVLQEAYLNHARDFNVTLEALQAICLARLAPSPEDQLTQSERIQLLRDVIPIDFERSRCLLFIADNNLQDAAQ